MKIIYMGTPDFAVTALNGLAANGFEIKAVVTGKDKSKGRSGKPVPPPVKKAALELGLPVLQPDDLKNDTIERELRALKPDVIVVAAYGKILPKRILDLPPYGCVNIHASLLPAYRGAAPVQWAVLNGEKTSGVTIMRMSEGLDTGDILIQRAVALEPRETSESLFRKLASAGAELIVEGLHRIEDGTAVWISQPEKSPTAYARMIAKRDGLIDWNRSAEELERFVRGMNSWPSAFTYFNGKMVRIWSSELLEMPDH